MTRQPSPAEIVQGRMSRRRWFIASLLVTACGAAPPAAKLDQDPTLALARRKNVEPLPKIVSEPAETPGSAAVVAEPTASQQPQPAPASAPAHQPRDLDLRAAAAAADGGDLGPARRLRAQLQRIDAAATLEDRMLAHALSGRAHLESRQEKQARAEYEKVLVAWADPVAAMKAIAGEGELSADSLRRAGQALSAAGEALFFRAEQERRAADAHRAPRYRGPDTDAGVQEFIRKQVAPWVQQRRAKIDLAQRAYQKILELRPVPPPRWVVAGAAQVAAMLDAFANELTSLPMPPQIRKDPELKRAYEQALSDASAPMREAARTATRTCKDLARRFGVQSSYSRKCGAESTQ